MRPHRPEFIQLGGGQDIPHTGAGGLPGRPRRQVPLGNAGVQPGVPAQPGADSQGRSGLSLSEKDALDLITDHLQIAN